MGVFTRFRDIVSATINAMLDRAEDPEKLIRLLIREMEDTLIEIKAACAAVMADRKKVSRQLQDARNRAEYWNEKAQLAVDKGRDDLAREALIERRRFGGRAEALDREKDEAEILIRQYREDIQQLEDKLKDAKEKQRMLTQRHIHARKKMRAQTEIRKVDGNEAIRRFDELESKIERLEAEADLVNFAHKSPLEEKLDRLSVDDEIEQELQRLKSPQAAATGTDPQQQ